jgi:hypothetical protein
MEITGVQIAGLIVMAVSTLLLAWGVTMLDGKVRNGDNNSSSDETSGTRPSGANLLGGKKRTNGSKKKRPKNR